MEHKASDLFMCENCGWCCKGYGGTVITEKDAEKIAAFIDENPKHFFDKYCRISGRKWVLAQGANDFCIFWNKGCRIHPVKPRMCKAWPFLESVLRDVDNWNIMAASCPGMRTDIPDDVIITCVREELAGISY
jgi:Fe-S-cluster containining protein